MLFPKLEFGLRRTERKFTYMQGRPHPSELCGAVVRQFFLYERNKKPAPKSPKTGDRYTAANTDGFL